MDFEKTAKIWPIFSLRFESLAGTQRYKRGSVKNQNNRIADWEESYDITDTCSPDFNFLKSKFCDTVVLLLTHELKHKI